MIYISCYGCTSKVSLIAAKKIGSKYYCPKCYDYVISMLKRSYNIDAESED